MSVLLRREVLRKYKDLLKFSNTWRATVDTETDTERVYIREEARKLFRKNKSLKNEEEIRLCLNEATSRMEMARHYSNPYPRPVNFAPGHVVESRDKKAQTRKNQQSKPIYIHSLDK